jgi:hypothetical protein
MYFVNGDLVLLWQGVRKLPFRMFIGQNSGKG